MWHWDAVLDEALKASVVVLCCTLIILALFGGVPSSDSDRPQITAAVKTETL
jgi:hypothetical protein